MEEGDNELYGPFPAAAADWPAVGGTGEGAPPRAAGWHPTNSFRIYGFSEWLWKFNWGANMTGCLCPEGLLLS